MLRPIARLAVAALLGLSLVATSARAEEKKATPAIANVQAALAKLSTPLTAEQKSKVDAAVTEATAEFDKLAAEIKKAGKERTEEQKKEQAAKRQAVAKKFQADVNAALTPEQQKELKAAMSAINKENKEKRAAADAKKEKPAEAPAN